MNKRLENSSIRSNEAADDIDDLELVDKARQGDEGAFRALFERYHRRAFSLACGVVRNRDDALDVVQEAFIKAHRHIGKFEGTSSFYTWLYRIVMNLAMGCSKGTIMSRLFHARRNMQKRLLELMGGDKDLGT